MKIKIAGLMNVLGWLTMIILASLVLTCGHDDFLPPLSQLSKETLNNVALDNGAFLAATDDVMDFSGGALAGAGITDGSTSPYGRAAGSGLPCTPVIHHSFDVDRTRADSLILTGILTIDFGSGTACNDSTQMRSGKITIDYTFIKVLSTRAFLLVDTVSFVNFQKGHVTIGGTFINQMSSNLVSILVIQGATLTYPDGTLATFNGQLKSVVIRGNSPAQNGCLRKEVTGFISGNSRLGDDFTSSIDKELVFNYGCFHNFPVSGTIDLLAGSIESEIDFGDGNCDKVYTITSNGATITYSFDNKHGEGEEGES